MSPSLQTMGFFMSDINFCNTKEQLNHLGEVVTGKVDGSPTGADIDTSTLSYTGQVRKTLPALEAEYLEAIQGAGGVSIGVWTSGVTTFDAYNEYAVYNGIPYKPRTATGLPYVAQGSDPTAAPDDANVQPYQEITEAQVVALLPEYTTVFVDATGEGGMIDDTSAIQDAINKASALQYVKRGVKIVLRAPKNYYQVSSSLNFNELWNVSIECEVANSWNRSEVGDIETTGGNIHWIGNSTDSLFNFGQYCYGIQVRNIIANGRDALKLAYDLASATPSVLRDFYFENWGAINCDFGAVFGDITGTDLAPVMSINPRFNNCKSAAILLNSGNLQFTSKGGFITNNGFAPTAGNSFIPDGDNQGYQILQRSGHSWVENVTLDGVGSGLPASGENVKCSGGTMFLSGWDDTPEVTSVNITGTTQAFEFGHWRHFDGDMTPANTPVSILHNAPCCVDMGSGLNIFGDVVMNSGANSGINTSGVNFLDLNSGFSGTGLRGLAGVVKNKSTDDTVIVVGGDQKFIGSDLAPVKRSVISRQNRPADYYKSETGSVATTFTIKDNGQYEWLTNVWFDTSTSEYKSVSAGSWSRKLVTPNGVEQLNSGSASGANEVLTTSIAAGFRQGSGANGKWQLELSSNKFSFDVPVTGSVVRGDTFMRSSATPSGKAGDIVTTSGTVGSTAVLKPFGVIDA